ncbi:putative immunity protein [Propionibacteriaceae bacterium G1746]|uniref:putative immunity protein n=1 Tax=Aestuariimicrobium sp. G57 TaxID=3418485 RepID=UPI003C1403E2
MTSAQALSEADRRVVALWAADSAERVLPLFEAEAPDDARARDGIARARAFGHGELDAAGEIRRRFEAGRAAQSATSHAGVAAARAAGQASGVAHMGAHALGAAAYAAKAAGLASANPDDARRAEVRWQLAQMTDEVRAALKGLPLLGEDSSGPLGPGLLASGELAVTIREIQSGL